MMGWDGMEMDRNESLIQSATSHPHSFLASYIIPAKPTSYLVFTKHSKGHLGR